MKLYSHDLKVPGVLVNLYFHCFLKASTLQRYGANDVKKNGKEGGCFFQRLYIKLIKSHIENQPKTVEQIANGTGIQLNQLLNILCKLYYSGQVIFNIDSKNIDKYTEVWV